MPDDQTQLNLPPRYLWERFQSWWRGLRAWVKIVLALAALAGIGFVIAQVVMPPQPAYQDARLSLQPASGTFALSGVLEVAINVSNPSAQALYAVEVEVTFPSDLLAITDGDCVNPSSTQCISAEGTVFPTRTEQTVSAPAGTPPRRTIRIIRGAPAPGVAATTAKLVTLRFAKSATGLAEVNFVPANSHVVTVVDGAAQDILFRPDGITDGSYIIGGLTCSQLNGFICASGGAGTCAGGTNQSQVCTNSNPDCPVPGKCKTGTGVMTCENNINISCIDNDDCTTYAACTAPLTLLCKDGAREGQACTSPTNCPPRGAPADRRCKFNDGRLTFCLNDPSVECRFDENCEANLPCVQSQGAVCLGTELPDSDPATVCCSQSCTAVVPNQLYIRNVGTATVSATATAGSEGITWSTYPDTTVASLCSTTLTGGIGGCTSPTDPNDPNACNRSRGDPTEHSIVLNGLAVNTQYTFTINCTVPGYTAATYTGTFTIGASTAEELRILDLQVADVTYQSARVTYGTNKPVTGHVEWLDAAAGTDCASVDYTLGGRDILDPPPPTLAHQTLLRGLSQNQRYCVHVRAQYNSELADDYIDFTTPAQATLAPDANVLMRVSRDRVCKNWLYCQSAVRLKNQQGKSEDLCFDLGVCDTLDPSGACANPVALEATTTKSDLIFQTPSQVHFIKDVSGYSKVGLDWSHCSGAANIACSGNSECPGGQTCVRQRVDGLYPYVRMEEVGRTVRVSNGNFESGQLSPWRAHGKAGLYNYRSSFDTTNPSYVLKVVPGIGTYTGARVPLGPLYAGNEALQLTFRARTDASTAGRCSGPTGQACDAEVPNSCPAGETCIEGKRISVQLAALSGQEQFYNFVIGTGATTTELGPAWATYQMRLGSKREDGGLPASFSSNAALQFVQFRTSDASSEAFFIDDVSLQPVLEIATAQRLPRSCRLYPKPDAPACDFLELSSGKEWRGWKGYCVERQDPNPDRFLDPSNDCLIWWPVDVLAGASDLFAGEEVAGYKGRKPLYYCLESKGDWPYFDRQVSGFQNSGQREARLWSFDVSGLEVYRDEVIEVRVNEIKIDHDGDSSGDCQLYVENPEVNQAVAAGNIGTLSFNGRNKVHWSDSLESGKLDCGDGNKTSFNPYAWIRCSQRGRDNDCNIMTGRLEFNAQGRLQNVHVKFHDGGPNEGRGEFGSVTITYRGERCNVIAQVVTPEGDATPYTSKLTPGGWSADGGNLPRYPYNHDFEPYGGLVPPAGLGTDPGDPSTWPGSAYVEAPLKDFGQRPPYQYRAGSPYGIGSSIASNLGICSISQRFCQLNDPNSCQAPSGNVCVTDIGGIVNLSYCSITGELCDPSNPQSCGAAGDTCTSLPPSPNATAGRVCITGSQDRLGKSCEEENCGFVGDSSNTPGICAGLDKPKAIPDWSTFLGTLQGGVEQGKRTLSQLFVRAYGVWAFDESTRRYKECRYPVPPGGGDPNPPGCVEPWDMPANVPADTQPRVRMIVVEGPSLIKRAGGVVLKFTSSVHGDHLPLTGWRVDWGDRSAVTEVAGLRIAPKSSKSDPHVALHTYQCGDNGAQVGRDPLPSCSSVGRDYNCFNGTECVFKPAVQVTDNWGLCNGGSGADCAKSFTESPAVWAAYSGVIRVKP